MPRGAVVRNLFHDNGLRAVLAFRDSGVPAPIRCNDGTKMVQRGSNPLLHNRLRLHQNGITRTSVFVRSCNLPEYCKLQGSLGRTG